jgi:hypothetical protein
MDIHRVLGETDRVRVVLTTIATAIYALGTDGRLHFRRAASRLRRAAR